MKDISIRITQIITSLACALFMVLGSMSYAADEKARAQAVPMQVKSVKAKTASSPCAGGAPLPGGGGNYASGCCESPPPFPGLACCDTRDCGWFNCDSEMKQSGKKFRRSQ